MGPAGRTPFDIAADRYFNESPSPENKETLVREAKGLVYHFARLYGSGYHTDDLTQAGTVGLLKAIANYKDGMGASFVTYAGHCILGEIRHYVRKESSYYAPGCVVGLQNKVNFVIDEHLKEYGAAPTAAEIADVLGVRAESVTKIMNAGLVDFSEIDRRGIKTVRHETFRLPIEDKIFLEQAMKKLSEIQKTVVYLLFYYDLTQSEVAKRLGISQRQVSRIKEKSIAVLKDEAGEGTGKTIKKRSP